MTTNKAAEALRDALVKAYQVDAVGTFIYDDPTLTDRLSAIIAEATAPLEADMAELRRAIAMTTQAFEAEVERLRAVLKQAIGEAYCPSSGGGTEGRWCLNHDTPMVNKVRCSMVEGWLSALAAAPAVAPARDSAPNPPGERCAWAQRCGMPESDRRHQDPWDMHPGLYKHDFQPEPAP